MPPQIYKSIFAGEQDVEIAPKRKKLTVFFSDIAGFTDTVEALQSEELTHLLNQYLTEMSKIALEHGATVGKFIGDAILAFFGDPVSRGASADAIACARMDNIADVVISNCVINLVPDKAQVFREAFRVLKPGGRLAISDIVNVAPLPADLAADPALLCGCVAGAASAARIAEWLADAGFADVRVAAKPETRELIASWAPSKEIENYVVSAAIEARKPAAA